MEASVAGQQPTSTVKTPEDGATGRDVRAATGEPKNGTKSQGASKPQGGEPGDRKKEETPWFLTPRMPEKYPHESQEPEPIVQEPALYRSLYLLDTLGPTSTEPAPLTGPIDPFDDAHEATQSTPPSPSNSQVQGAAPGAQQPAAPKVKTIAHLPPAFGVLTVHEQRWEQRGLALGNLLQSICLAPGEVTQIAVTRWERSTKGVSAEVTEQTETVSSQAEQDRAVNEVQRSVAREQQWGSSSSNASSTSSRAGGSWGLFGIGASASTATTSTSVLTAQFSAGNRNLEAESTNQVSQRTAEHSQALRSRRQSVIREVTEKESETLTARVLANYNRRHTLNILFFEVLQLYRVHTKLQHWERCLFVPMVPLEFDKPVVEKHKAALLEIARELGAQDLLAALEKSLESKSSSTLSQAEERLRDIKEAYAASQDFEAARAKNAPRPEVEKALQRYKDIARHCGLPGIGMPQQMKWRQLITKAETHVREEKLRDKITGAEELNRIKLFLSQQLWLRMSPYHIFRVLQNYKEPGCATGKPLSAVLDPTPVGVFGNYLAFRWGFADDDNGKQQRNDFEKKYLKTEQQDQMADTAQTDPNTKEDQDPRSWKSTREKGTEVVGLPTSGIFAEAVLGQGKAAEEVDPSFGKWNDPENRIPILPPRIAALQSRDRHHDLNLAGQDFSSSLAQLRAEKLDDISHIDKALSTIGKADLFRNMGGLEQAINLATKLGELSSAGAKEAAEEATKIQAKILDTFKEILNSDVGKAAVAEFMAPGFGGKAMLGLTKNGGGTPAGNEPQTTGEKDKTEPIPAK